MSAFITSYLGSVNRWECDENDHMNVRFFLDKAQQGIGLAMAEFGVLPAAEAAAALLEARRIHIRFLREARLAAPLKIDVGIISLDRRSATVLAEMRHSQTDEVHATFLTDLVLATLPGAAPPLAVVPDYAAPRGVPASAAGEHELDLDGALAAGFKTVGAGLVAPTECGYSGWMAPAPFMGRISDGMPNLYAACDGPAGSAGRGHGVEGGAVLEYRMDFHGRLRAGDGYRHLAGLKHLGEKTYDIVHLVFDAATRRCVVSAEAVGIAMDLESRRAIAIPDHRRRAMEGLLIRR